MTENNKTNLSDSERLYQEKGSTHDFNLSDSERALEPASPLQGMTKDVIKDVSTKKNPSSGSKSTVGRVDKSKRVTDTPHQLSSNKSHKK